MTNDRYGLREDVKNQRWYVQTRGSTGMLPVNGARVKWQDSEVRERVFVNWLDQSFLRETQKGRFSGYVSTPHTARPPKRRPKATRRLEYAAV